MKFKLDGFTAEDRKDFTGAVDAVLNAERCIYRILRRNTKRKGPYSMLCWLDWVCHELSNGAKCGSFDVDDGYCESEDDDERKEACVAMDVLCAERENPTYPSWYRFTVAQCDKCGELYEPAYQHICRKKNSYPVSPMSVEDKKRFNV